MTIDYRRAQPTIVYSIRTGADWIDLATDEGQKAFPVAKLLEKLSFSGYGEISGFSAEYLIKHGFTFTIQ